MTGETNKYDVYKLAEDGSATSVATGIEAGDEDAAIEIAIEQAPNRMLASGRYSVRRYTSCDYDLSESHRMVITKAEAPADAPPAP